MPHTGFPFSCHAVLWKVPGSWPFICLYVTSSCWSREQLSMKGSKRGVWEQAFVHREPQTLAPAPLDRHCHLSGRCPPQPVTEANRPEHGICPRVGKGAREAELQGIRLTRVWLRRGSPQLADSGWEPASWADRPLHGTYCVLSPLAREVSEDTKRMRPTWIP